MSEAAGAGPRHERGIRSSVPRWRMRTRGAPSPATRGPVLSWHGRPPTPAWRRCACCC